MSKPGSIALQDVAARTAHIDVACSRCERRGRYSTARLVAQYGGDYAMTDLGAELADCPRRNGPVYQRCDVYYPGLGDLMSDPKTL